MRVIWLATGLPSFYLALIRSIFEHCSVILPPETATHLEQFVAIHKRAIEWINGEPYSSNNDDKLATEQKKLNSKTKE